jgi:Tol biopolymer transport system component
VKKSNNKTLFLTLILAAFIIIIGVSVGKNVDSNSNVALVKTNSSSVDATSSTEQDGLTAFKGKIVFLSKSSDENAIYMLTSKEGSKKIYTDKDEDLKIKSAFSVTNDGKILALMGSADQEFGGSLYLIDTTSAGKKDKLIDVFASTDSPMISPDGKKIAYTLFNNSEIDYGFTLYVMNRDGSGKQKIISDASQIKILTWNDKSDKIAYLKGDTSNENSIFVSDLVGTKVKLVTSFKEKIYSASWANSNFIVSKGPIDSGSVNKAEVFEFDESGKNLKRLTNDDKFSGFAFISTDGKFLIYANIEYSNSVDFTKTGEIGILNLQTNDYKKIGEANYLIGWLNS